jgi:CheY-like chemotaxis protein
LPDPRDEEKQYTRDPQFLLNALHDIRAGLTVIGGYSSLILEGDAGDINDAQKESIEFINKSYNQILALNNDLTDIIRLEMGIWKMKRESVNVNNVLAGVLDNSLPRITEREIVVENNITEDSPMTTGDPEGLERALSEIFFASQYLAPMGGRIIVQLTEREGDIWEFTIQDNGVALSRDDSLRIFEPFYKSESLPFIENKDITISLCLARMLIRNHGGKVSLLGLPNVGNKFTVILNKKKAAQRLKILIVEDNPAIAKMYGSKLKQDFNVIIASTGREGLDKAVSEKPDLMVVDVLMPGMDGFALCQQIKANPEFSEMPIIFLSNIVQANLVQRAKNMGAMDFLSKSQVSPGKLADRIKVIFEASLPMQEE